jgi:hypothetical protein
MKAELIPLRPAISKAAMRAATDSAHLHIEHFGDAVRELSMKLFVIGHTVRPRYRAEFLKVLQFIQNDLPMDAESIACISICLDILRERYSA